MKIAAAIIFIAAITAFIISTGKTDTACSERGGVLVKGLGEYVCVKPL